MDFLTDLEAERCVIRGLWEGKRPPGFISLPQFTQYIHRELYAYCAHMEVNVEKGEFVDAPRMVKLWYFSRHGHFEYGPGSSWAEKYGDEGFMYQAVGLERVTAIEAIDALDVCRMGFHQACRRVAELALRRQTIHRAKRLIAMLEQASVDEKEASKENSAIGELIEEIRRTKEWSPHGG